MDADDVFAALREFYAPGAVLVPQVGDSVGYSTRRHMDAVACGVWPSRGLFVYAVEIKVDRGDLRRELAEPEKAESVAKYCDRMYLATPAGLVKDIETLPPAWGLLEAHSEKRVEIRKPAAELTPLPLDRKFMMAVIRSAATHCTEEAAIRDRITLAKMQLRAEIAEQRREEIKRVAELEAAVRRYELGFGGHSTDQITRAIYALERLGRDSVYRSQVHQLLGMANAVVEAANELSVLAEAVAKKPVPAQAEGSTPA